MKRKLGIVIGTFLPFHKGHEMLIKFAKEYMRNIRADSEILVLISSRSQEPISGEDRQNAIIRYIRDSYGVDYSDKVAHHKDDNAPQNPNGDNDVEFWKYWKGVIKGSMLREVENYDEIYFFSSEPYGEKLAKLFNGKHVYFDKERFTNNISGTKIRNDPFKYSDYINRDMRNSLVTDFVMFGAESVGKTTMTKELGKHFKSLTLQEYARPYLMEQEDKSPSIENMKNIFIGQSAYEKSALSTDIGQLVNFLDTDIMSTVGYAEMIGMDFSKFKNLIRPFAHKKHYFVLTQDEVPYEHDVLRYGNGVRESTDQYWIDLLEKYGRNYTIIRGKTLEQRVDKVRRIVESKVKEKFNFERE